MSRKVIALLGSTRGKKTASESIVDYISGNGNAEGFDLVKYRAHEIFNKQDKLDDFMNDVIDSDTLLISSAVYVHSVPYPLTVVLENMSAIESRKNLEGKKLLSIFHSGYPEDIQRKASFEICENFAKVTNMEWLGGIGFGG